MLTRTLVCLGAAAWIVACSGSRPATDPGSGDVAETGDSLVPVLVPEEEMLFSEVTEFVKLGQDGLRDSLWFQAGENFDSALVRLAALEQADSLSPSVYAHIRLIRADVEKLLVFAVARTGDLAEPAPFTQEFDEEMEEVPDSSVRVMDSITHSIDPKGYTLPVSNPLHPRVLQAMAVFMGQGRGYFSKWLARKSRYEDLIHAKLAERGMPADLIYLAMCESGFNPKAWSKASASGMWQFISGTGRRYGLHDDWWYDPRRDPMLATDAALDYLEDLYEEFQDWHLAMAAYNCGEGRIRRMRAQDSTLSYWDMPLPQETRFYVPKILAAMIIAHDPARYGFVIDKPEPRLAFDTATVTHCLSIATIAKAAGATEDTIVALNSGLRRWCTPPNRVTGFTLYLPEGSRETFWKNYQALDKSSLVNWHHHVVQKGEFLGAIASRYRVSLAALKATNKLKGSHLSIGQSLLIPLAPGDAARYAETEPAAPPRASKYSGGTYRVRAGDNLFDIARRFGTTVQQLMAANHMKSGSLIKVGQRLRLGPPPPADDDEEDHRAPAVRRSGQAAGKAAKASGDESGAFAFHSVEAGETIYSISRALGVSEDDLIRWNGITGNRILAGQKLRYLAGTGAEPPAGAVREADASRPAADGEKQYYIVKSGDNLWDISVRYRSTVQKLKDLNGRLPTVLRPGTRIRVK